MQEWVDVGLISSEQARRIRQHEAASERSPLTLSPARPPQAGPSLVVEALGYLGGVVMLVGASILVSAYWSDLSVALRVVLVGATAATLIGVGFAVPERLGEAAGRLRSVLWAAGVAATGALLAVVCAEVLDLYDEHQLWIVGSGTTAVAAVLWSLRRTALQQLALFVPLMLAAVGAGLEVTSTDSAWGGAAMWGVAVLWTTAAWLGRLEPRVSGVALGALGAVAGSLIMGDDVGIGLGLATGVATVALALAERNLVWLGVGAVALLLTTPRAANTWFPGRLSAALTFIVTGGLLVGAAAWVARRRTPEEAPDRAP
ncbi:hypothetical protein JCM18899A_45180 [Nocardioides sp. AN3]